MGFKLTYAVHKVCPCLHHFLSLPDKFGVIVRGVCTVVGSMGKLGIDMFFGIVHFKQARSSGSAEVVTTELYTHIVFGLTRLVRFSR